MKKPKLKCSRCKEMSSNVSKVRIKLAPMKHEHRMLCIRCAGRHDSN